MYGLSKSHKLGLLALAAVLAFALSATAVYGWGTSEQPQQEKPGEHAGKGEENKGKEESENKGEEHQGQNKGENEEESEQPKPGPTGPVGPVGGGPTVNNQVSNQVTGNTNAVPVNTQSQAPANTPAETNVKAETETLAGPEVAQNETAQSQPPSQPAQGNQPAQLASTGFNAGALAGVGALLIGASLLLFRRRRSA
jgi:LPXTG-motif cell wall-anchored protein